jgi:hypothetical protein
MITSTETIAVAGHRLSSFNDRTSRFAREELSRVFTRLGADHDAKRLNTNLGAGTGLWAANIADELGYSLHAYLPFLDEPTRCSYPSAVRGAYQRLLAKCETEAVYTTLPEPGDRQATSRAMLDGYDLADEAMVAHADVLVAVWEHRRNGGTAHALSCAVRAQIPTVVISIRDMATFVASPAKLAEFLGVTPPLAAAA